MDEDKKIPGQLNETIQLSLFHGLMHDIGHPLSGIRMHLSNIIEGRIPPSEVNTRLIAINEMAKSMEMLIGNYRILSEVSRSKVKSYESSKVSIKNLINSLVGSFTLQAKSRGLTIQIQNNEEFLVNTDATLLSLILWNLLDNAIKYSHEKSNQNSEVSIRYWLTDEYVIFEIINWGFPIPNNEVEKIFEMKYRSQNAMRVSPAGLGIGLFVARKCAEVLNSEINIISNENRITATLKIRRSGI